ncbi:hypothetical protein EXIGLDRAFT_116506 [Exidia glandulosa HHB12029]|uniref:Uncharacterized protein n=1 Tax=Exidia glandulosa HHB12029 TaxID=1314781 RepID=A0A165GJJ7_EXIGL|nr:hypothetical protein EXIGLDRAFT_116506 [Exidia glandulosa HHB12029]
MVTRMGEPNVRLLPFDSKLTRSYSHSLRHRVIDIYRGATWAFKILSLAMGLHLMACARVTAALNSVLGRSSWPCMDRVRLKEVRTPSKRINSLNTASQVASSRFVPEVTVGLRTSSEVQTSRKGKSDVGASRMLASWTDGTAANTRSRNSSRQDKGRRHEVVTRRTDPRVTTVTPIVSWPASMTLEKGLCAAIDGTRQQRVGHHPRMNRSGRRGLSCRTALKLAAQLQLLQVGAKRYGCTLK